MNKFEQIDYVFALKITLRNIFKPLYKDYSFIGHILGFIFRLTRIILSSLIYTVLFIIAAAIYLLWLFLPLILILKTFTTSDVF
jgi:hypothetical protein